MGTDQYFAFPCDVCGATDPVEVGSVKIYTGDPAVYTCKCCGFVFAHRRRADEAIRRAWAEDMFDGTFEVDESVGGRPITYTARIPAMIARLTYAMEFVDSEIGLTGKSVCDVGAGEGDFLVALRKHKNPSALFGVEPSANNGRLLRAVGLDHFIGGVEEFVDSGEAAKRHFDVVTVNWTIENSQSARRFMENVYKMLPVGGHVAVATGSRILVPFKKPLHMYFPPNTPVDLHSFHFSYNALCGLMAATGFRPVHHNRYMDTDYLCVIGEKTDGSEKIDWQRDDYTSVLDFFERWKTETENYYRK